MFQINLKSAEPQWYDWPEKADEEKQAKLLIRQRPASDSEMRMRRSRGKDESDAFDLEIVQEGSDNKKAFMYCLMDSEGLTDQEGKSINVNDKIDVPIGKDKKMVKMSVKEFIFDYLYDSGLPDFVLLKGKVARTRIEEEKKS